MNPYVRDRINRKLDTLSDERLYQILDYVEFLESKYAEKSAPVANVFTRFAEGVEDKLRAGGVAVHLDGAVVGRRSGRGCGAGRSEQKQGGEDTHTGNSGVCDIAAECAGRCKAKRRALRRRDDFILR